MTTEEYKEKLLPNLPQSPGVYRFIDKEDVVLYVGKAKNLKNRVSSYFGDKKHTMAKTKIMVRNAQRVEFTIVESEQDALLLEATWIRTFQPRFNIQLKDGKNYPYIVIKNERFPRIFITRQVLKDGAEYFGPYVQGGKIHAIMEQIKDLFMLRTCTLNLSEENINKGKYRVCLEYHIKNCGGPCQNFESEEEYNEKVKEIKHLLKGNFNAIKKYLKQQMLLQAEKLNFELAQQFKIKLEAFSDYQAKSTVVNPNIENADVFALETHDQWAVINYLKVANGAIINSYNLELKLIVDEDEQDLLERSVPYLVEKLQSSPSELITDFKDFNYLDTAVKVTCPQVGDKRKLLDLAHKNAKYHVLQLHKDAISKEQQVTNTDRILQQMQKDLRMKELPVHLECFDNSNIQGSDPVSAMVCFKYAKPSNRDYRHYHIKTVEGPNDFASMTEVVTRRYKRLLAEGLPLPQLILIDGGKGQLHAATEALSALGILEKVTVIGIAKRLEELFFPGDPIPLMLDKKSPTLKVLQNARNEAHRFGISFHRDTRSKNFSTSELSTIQGIGKTTSEKLLKHFGSIAQICKASSDEIVAVVGKKAAQRVIDFYDNKENNSTET